MATACSTACEEGMPRDPLFTSGHGKYPVSGMVPTLPDPWPWDAWGVDTHETV